MAGVRIADDVDKALGSIHGIRRITVYFRAEGDARSAAADALMLASASFVARGWDRQAMPPLGAPGVRPTPSGAEVSFDHLDDTEMFRDLLADMAHGLSTIGWTGVMTTLVPAARTLRLPDPAIPSVTAGLALPMDPELLAQIGPRSSRGGWYADAEATRHVVARAIDWVAEGPGSLSYSLGSRPLPIPDTVTALDLVHAELGRGENGMGVETIHLGGFRRVTFGPVGHITLDIAGHIDDWRDHLLAVTAEIRILAPWLRYAMVKRSRAPLPGYGSLINNGFQPMTRAISNYYLRSPLVEDHHVPDAYVLQLLGPKHLEHGPDLDHWYTERFNGMTLLSAKDPAPWMTAESPDPAVLRPARASLGTMVMTEQTAEEYAL